VTPEDIHRAMVRLRNQGRRPVVITVDHASYWDVFRWDQLAVTPEGMSMFGVPVEKSDEPGVRVIPEDWRGYGKGKVR
jgi:hypothetical protein